MFQGSKLLKQEAGRRAKKKIHTFSHLARTCGSCCTMFVKALLLLCLATVTSAWRPRGGGGGFTGGFGGGSISPLPSGEDGALFFLLPKKKYSSAPTHKL